MSAFVREWFRCRRLLESGLDIFIGERSGLMYLIQKQSYLNLIETGFF